MSRESYVFDRELNEIVPAHEFYARKSPAARSHLPSPHFISDTMQAAEHPCTGQMIDSKSRFERITRDHGCVTIGNDPARLRNTKEKKPDRKQIRESLQRSFAQHGLA